MKYPDLTKEFPRGPGEMLGGFVLLARMIDKCRATIAATNGEYRYNCPLDQNFFNFTGMDPEKLREFVATGASDEQIVEYVSKNTAHLSEDDICVWNYERRTGVPETAEQKAVYERIRMEVAPNHPHIFTWFQLLDAEEGRL